jgi:hypothetical protein
VHGVVSCFTTRNPTQEEFDTCDRYELTYESPVYDPSGSSYAEQEAAMMDSKGQLKLAEDKHPLWRQICPVHMAETFSDKTIKLQALSLTRYDSSLLQEMTSHVHIFEVNMSSLTADMRDGGGVDVATLAKNFGIGIESTKRTRPVTTQRGVKRMIHPSLSVRFRTNDRQMRYSRLHVTCFTDTMFSNSNSRQGNKAAQVFCTANGWTRTFPMAKEKYAHEALSLMFHRDGVPHVVVMDGAEAQIQGGLPAEVTRGWMSHQTDGATHTQIKCIRRFYQGTEARHWARNGQVRGTKASMG